MPPLKINGEDTALVLCTSGTTGKSKEAVHIHSLFLHQLEIGTRQATEQYAWWTNPLLRGEYPPVMRQLLDRKSSADGRNSAGLPEFDSTSLMISCKFCLRCEN